MSLSKITFIGAGNMASAILGGLLQQGFSASQIVLSDPNQKTLDSLKAKYGVQGEKENQQAIEGANVIILAVKPQLMQKVLMDLAPALTNKNPLILSIAAGINCDSLSRWLQGDFAVVRAMPNTPALLQAGATGLYANKNTSDTQKEIASKILDAVGVSCWLNKEEQLDTVTALSGSGPAYYFLFIEAMIECAEKMGLDRKMAKTLGIQTALGAAMMAKHSEVTVTELKNRVMSPGGTTEKAIASFEQDNLPGIIEKAMQAAAKRSKELAELD